MKPELSALIIKGYEVIKYDYIFITPTKNDYSPNKSWSDYMQDYSIDIDFMFDENEDIFLYMKTEINQGKKKLAGYSIFLEGALVLDKKSLEDLDEELRYNLLDAAVGMSVGSVRSFLSATTTHFPFGEYMLPAINLPNLIEQKRLLHEKARLEKKKVNPSKKKPPATKKK